MIGPATLVAALPPSSHDPDRVRDAADDILSSARYAEPGRSVFGRISDWLGDRLQDLLGALGQAGGNVFGTALAWVLLAVAVGLTVMVLTRRVGLGPVARAPRPDDTATVEWSRTSAQWRELAAQHEAEGLWADGLRCRHRALVADLVAAGAIADRPGRTAGEHARDVAAARPAAAPAFAAATEAFEAVWYGGAVADAEGARRFARLEAGVLDALVGGPVPSPAAPAGAAAGGGR